MDELRHGTTYYYDHETLIVGDAAQLTWTITPEPVKLLGIQVIESPPGTAFKLLKDNIIEIRPELKPGAIFRLKYTSEG